MVSLTNTLPDLKTESVLFLKIKTLFDGYKTDNLNFYVQDKNKAVISHDGENVIILNNGADIAELGGFLNFFGAETVLSDEATLKELNFNYKKLFVFKKSGGDVAEKSDIAASDDIYKILSQKFSMPPFESFATDFCYRLNRNMLYYFYKKDAAAAVCFISGNNLLLNGIASLKKGYGKKAIEYFGLKYGGFNLYAVCEESVSGFYEKCGFTQIDTLGLWEKK